jgi:6-phosphogluconate dehydrogenase
MEPYLTSFDGISHIAHVGNDVQCVHYAFMIQRAIENGMMQIYAEGSDVLRKAAGYENNDIGRTFKNWNECNTNSSGGGGGGGGLSNSYLSGISSRIFYKRDTLTKCGSVIDHIVDAMVSEPVDTWVTLEATRLNVPAPTINAAQETRFLSVMREERMEASSILRIPDGNDTPSVLKDQISEDLHNAMYCACLFVVSECLSIFEAASEVGSWDFNLEECVRMWKRPGSILQSTLMNRVHSALADDMGDSNCLLTIPIIASELQELHMPWRRIVALCFASAIPCPTLSSSLTHYDTYRCERLPLALIRAQRDYYDASGYDRLSERGWFSTCWIKEHTTPKRKEAVGTQMGGNKRTRKRKATFEGL